MGSRELPEWFTFIFWEGNVSQPRETEAHALRTTPPPALPYLSLHLAICLYTVSYPVLYNKAVQ